MGRILYYDFEIFRLDVENEQLLRDNQPLPLTPKAFKTLLILVQNYGQLVKKDDIINEIWHDSFVEEANLTQHIYILRKNLGNNIDGKPFIETIPKRGYVFTGEVRVVRFSENFVATYANSKQFQHDDSVLNEPILFVKDERHRSFFAPNIPDFHISEDSSVSKPIPVPPPNGFLKFGSLWMTLLLFGLLTGGIFLYQTGPNRLSAAGKEVKSIAVLPFRAIGEESSNAKLGFGMADAIITRLGKLQKIPIRPTSAVFQYAEKSVDPMIAGKELGVDSVLEGTVQREGEWVRVSIRLIKVENGNTLWAETFDEKFTYIFALQDSISTRVAKALSINPSNEQPGQIATTSASNTEAYEAYQLGIYFWNKRTKEDLEKAASYFEKSVTFDGNYAIAYAMLADSYNMLDYYKFVNNREDALNIAEEAAQKALSIDDSLAEANIAIAYVQIAKYKDYSASIRSLEKAIQLSPYNPTARIRYGWQLLRLGNIDQAYEQMRIARENDPLSPISNSALCSMLLIKRNFAEALEYSEKAVEIQPAMPLLKVQLASVLFLNGRAEEAIEILKIETEDPKNKYDALAAMAYIYAKTDKTKKAQDIFRQLQAEKDVSKRPSDLALIAFTLGKKEDALNYFKIALGKSNMLPLSILSDPFWDDVFKDKDFKELADKTKDNRR